MRTWLGAKPTSFVVRFSELDSGLSGLGSSPVQGHYVVSLRLSLNSQSTSLHQAVSSALTQGAGAILKIFYVG